MAKFTLSQKTITSKKKSYLPSYNRLFILTYTLLIISLFVIAFNIHEYWKYWR